MIEKTIFFGRRYAFFKNKIRLKKLADITFSESDETACIFYLIVP